MKAQEFCDMEVFCYWFCFNAYSASQRHRHI